MKIGKRMAIVFLLVFSLLISSVRPVQAAGQGEPASGAEALAIQAALDWADIFSPEEDYQVSEAVPIYNGDEILTSYCVSYTLNGEPSGYIVLEIQEDGVEVLEFTFCEDTEGLYSQLAVEETSKGKAKQDKKLYSNKPFDYYVKDASGDYYDKTHRKIASKEWKEEAKQYKQSIRSKKKAGEGSRFLLEDTLSGNFNHAGDPIVSNLTGYTVTERGQLPNYMSYSQSFIQGQTGKYACAVLAMTEIAAQKSILKNNSVKDTFNALWDASLTTVYMTTGGIQLGKTNYRNQQAAMISYCRGMGKNCYSTITSSPTYEVMKEAVGFGISGIYRYDYTGIDPVTNQIIKEGHAISVIGYCKAQTVLNTTKKFIMVCDGWNSGYRYYNLSDFIADSCHYIQYNIQ